MDEAYKYLYSLEKYGILLGLDNIKILLSLIGNPEKKFKSIHIVGTNGKGSTSAFLTSILMEAGYKVGTYTSPHLVDFSERITISGIPISHEEIKSLAFMMKDKIESSEYSKRPFTFFEVTTAMAFFYFAQKKVDIAVIEAGLGGRLDATNTLEPLLTIITTIGLEHKEFLGDTIEKIAFEKSAVIKKNTPCITGAKEEEALRVIRKEAESKNAPLLVLGKDFYPEKIDNYRFNFKGINRVFRNLILENLIGINQFDNASLAIAGIELITERGFNIGDENIFEGIRKAKWPGRFEIIRKNPPFIIDGAHNPQGVDSLIKNLTAFYPGTKFKIILTVLKDKDINEMIEKLKPFCEEIILVPNKNERSFKKDEFLQLFGSNPLFSFANDIPSVIKDCFYNDKFKGKPILFTGSLYGIGEAKEVLNELL
ncbi:MAG: bifunctional folylpolyglutamate synthase/dihydrofolate synthase [Proteobacteria bacterium]|nr:bifunctional folylpolyglutamate synthase/dihydrofolate synthase [Pseudomonadota bacterium]